MTHLLSLADLTDDELRTMVDRSQQFRRAPGRFATVLDGAVVGCYFRETSTRTRTAFSSGALRLGGRVVAYGPHDLQTNTGETVEDTAQVLGRMLDVLVARTADQAELEALAGQDRMPVVNAMSADEHPTQALADLATLAGRGPIDGLRVLYVGEGNSTAAALALALTRFHDVHLELRTPPGYGLAAAVATRARRQAARHSSLLVERHDMADLPAGVDVVYSTRWQTTGTAKPDPGWRETFAPFRIDSRLWEHSPGALFMHDLPANRDVEVASDVLDGPASIVFEQAENKMHSAMAVLEWCWAGRRRPAAVVPAPAPAGDDGSLLAAPAVR